jgi:high affinity sulfate transporter 1
MSDSARGVFAGIRWPRLFAGLQGVTLADAAREVSAGVTLAALMIPLNIGYAQVAGLPPAAGLYAAIVPLVVFALLASSRHLVTSPDASMATLVGAALVSFAAPGDPLRMQYALALAIVCAVLFFLFWLFRLAFLANFLSRAVMAGFITGLGIEVLTNQVRKILAAPHVRDATSGVLAAAERLQETLATSLTTEGYFVEVIALIHSIPRANLYSVAIGVGAFLIVRLMKRYAPKIPGALVALVFLTTLVALLGLPAKGVAVLGNTIPSGLPALTLPVIPLADYLRLLPGALAIVAILLCEGLLVVRSYSNKYGYKADGDQMLFAYGAANLAAGFTGSIVTGNSPSRSAAMDAAGSRSQLPSLVAAGTIALVMLFFTDLLAYLPNAALAGIVANAVLSLIEVQELRELWRMRRPEFWIAAVCLLSVLAIGPLRAVLIAFLLSAIDVIRRASHPDTAALVEAPDGSHFAPAGAGDEVSPSGLVIYRFGAPLYFANATLFLEEVEQLIDRAPTPVRWFVLDAEAMVDVDTTGAAVLRQAIDLLARRKITLAVSRADRSFRTWLEKYELMELIGQQRFYPTNRHAAEAFREDQARVGAGA